MKRMLISLIVLSSLGLFWPGGASSDPMDELLDSFRRDFNAAEPPYPQSSIKTDYKIAQTALGTLYTTESLNLLYKQNQALLIKYDEMLRKYDQIVQQNKEVVRLLGVLAGRLERRDEGRAATPGADGRKTDGAGN